MKRKPIKIIFEKVRLVYYFLIKYYLWKGYEVSVFHFTHGDKKPKWLLKMMAQDMVQRIYVPTISKEEDFCIDQTELIYNCLQNLKLPKIIADLYESNETALIFKRALLDGIYKAIYINSYFMSGEMSPIDTQKVCFIPDSYKFYEVLINKYGNYKTEIFKKVFIPKWALAVATIFRITDMLKSYSFSLLHILSIMILSVLGKMKKAKALIPKHYKYAISLNSFHQIMFQGKRSFDFLLDHNEINKENTIFILFFKGDENWIKKQKEKGCSFIRADEKTLLLNLMDFNFKRPFIMAAIKAFGKMLRSGGGLSVNFTQVFLDSLRIFIKGHLIFRQISFDNFIYTNQESYWQIAFNILMEKHGCKTWNYHSFIGSGLLYCKDEEFSNKRQMYWAYLNSYYSVLPNKDTIRFNQLHKQQVRKYYDVGCLYSQLVRESISSENKIEFMKNCFEQNYSNQHKVISFFDTSFIPAENAVTSYSDALGFYEDIIRLLKNTKDLLLIIKHSKAATWFTAVDSYWCSLNQGRKIIKLFDVLKSNPRVFWAGETGDTSAIMAHSDLVVTHCMSSPTVEALGAGKKAIWYESGNKHRGIMYDRIPGLVIHGYEALEKRIEELLYKITDEEYNHYLDEHIKGRVESYVDGRALTRFRELLSGVRD